MTTAPDLERFWAVVPAGGAGTRLWPVSRAASPKFLHDLTGSGRTLIQATVDRLRCLAPERVLVVTGAAHAAAVAEQVPDLPSDLIIAEPSPRDSMAAIGLAAAVLELRDPEAILGSFAADHVIRDEEAFAAAVTEAVGVAQRDDLLVTIGIEPTFPSTGFGYIQMGPRLRAHPTAARVRQFVEKPDARRAASYLATGEFRWNAGMFVVRASTLLDLLAGWHPDLAAGLREIAAAPSLLEERWAGLEKISIDHAVAEPAADEGRVAVVPGVFDWDDVGDFKSLSGLLPKGEGSMTVVGDPAQVQAVDSGGLVVSESGRMVAVVGLEDVVVVETSDALLVASRERAQDVKLVVEALKAAGRTDLV
ncbi:MULTISPECIES: mannose-1-phosphate guanylyltransferase [Janibacter]|uniref:mannose-1-phosphate guanylyltransferase n=1 Tax=Janibacter TaxID=53457 RepID=UPI000837870A|nr:mannose-1-phosphate guanylyltransferase [Janibacter terrae]